LSHNASASGGARPVPRGWCAPGPARSISWCRQVLAQQDPSFFPDGLRTITAAWP
jgi:hypothetical protein